MYATSLSHRAFAVRPIGLNLSHAHLDPPSATHLLTCDLPDTPVRAHLTSSSSFSLQAVQKTWEYIATPPDVPALLPAARTSRVRTSWRPLTVLTYGTAARMGLCMTSRLLAHYAAIEVRKSGKLPPPTPYDIDGPRHAVPRDIQTVTLCALFFATSLGVSLLSAHQFAADTRRICPTRARISIGFAIMGCMLTTLGTWLGEYYHAKAAVPNTFATMVPTALGVALLMIRLPHSFVASELVHGNTPGKYRSHLGTMLFPLGSFGLSCGYFLRGESMVPGWSSDLLFSAATACLVLAVALPRTDLSRSRAEEP